MQDVFDEIAADCAAEGWDGYGGDPVTAEVIAAAREVDALLDIAVIGRGWHVAPGGDGSIGFELWPENPEPIRNLVIDVERDSTTAYWVSGQSAFTKIGPGTPAEIVQLVAQVLNASATADRGVT